MWSRYIWNSGIFTWGFWCRYIYRNLSVPSYSRWCYHIQSIVIIWSEYRVSLINIAYIRFEIFQTEMQLPVLMLKNIQTNALLAFLQGYTIYRIYDNIFIFFLNSSSNNFDCKHYFSTPWCISARVGIFVYVICCLITFIIIR